MAPRVWTCQRRSGGVKCGQTNARRYQLCQKCGKRRPATKPPAHRVALEQPYEVFVEANGGVDACGICGKERVNVALNRDHDHATHEPRGVLCWRHNQALELFGDSTVLLRAAIAYLERSAA